MKRFGLAVLTGILCFGVTACGGSTEMYAANVRGAVAGKTAAAETTAGTAARTSAETAAPETAAGESDSGTENKASSKETAEPSAPVETQVWTQPRENSLLLLMTTTYAPRIIWNFWFP